jgi:DNA-binding response OmpR family regulator
MAEDKGTILVIDDDMALQAVIDVALRNEGYQVVEANDGEEGIRMVSRVAPDLVICDIMMPNMDGVEMFAYIKDILQTESVPVIMMTALSRKPWFRELELEGAIILHKPFEMNQLLEMVGMLLQP